MTAGSSRDLPLDVIRELAAEDSTMLIVSHEIGFVHDVSHRVAFVADGRVQEIGSPAEISGRLAVTRTQNFIGRFMDRSRRDLPGS